MMVVDKGINTITTFTASTPLTVYFLGFLNYFTVSSLYILLNFRIPRNIYKYLTIIYGHVNSNLLELFKLKINVPKVEEERVTNDRYAFFGISSNYMTTNVVSITFMTANILLVLLLQRVCLTLRKDNPIRKLMKA